MKKTVLTLAIALAIACANTGLAAAADFTFHVPVELHSIPPQLAKWGVEVMVTDQYGIIIADQSVYFTVTNGEYSQTHAIAFDAMPGKSPGYATKYSVNLMCQDPTSYTWAQPAVNTMRAAGGPYGAPYPYDTTKPYVGQIDGTIPAAKGKR